jgi:hypothetical protein
MKLKSPSPTAQTTKKGPGPANIGEGRLPRGSLTLTQLPNPRETDVEHHIF